MIYIIVLNWNGISDMLACLDSLLNLDEFNIKIVVCDNGSTDNSIAKIESWYCNLNRNLHEKFKFLKIDTPNDFSHIETPNHPGIYLIDIGENLGYAGGNNIGINFALSQKDIEYVWLLNNDTEVEPQSLSAMIHAFQNNNIGVCGSRLIYFSDRDKLQGLGGVFNPIFCSSYHYKSNENSQLKFNDAEISQNIDYVIGASMLINKETLADIGVLCEDYFLYFEEIDYCLRAKKQGHNIFCATQSIVYHKEGASTQNNKGIMADFYWVRNRILIAKKFFPQALVPVYISLFATLINRLRRKEWVKAKNVFRIICGCRDFLK